MNNDVSGRGRSANQPVGIREAAFAASRWSCRLFHFPLAVVVLAASALFALGEETDGYASIASRNAFGLKPPLPPQIADSRPTPAPLPMVGVELTGVLSEMSPVHPRRALLEIVPAPGMPLVRHVVKEGDTVESVEVLSVDVAKGQVTLRNRGILTNICLKVAKAGSGPTPSVGLSSAHGNPIYPPMAPVPTGHFSPSGKRPGAEGVSSAGGAGTGGGSWPVGVSPGTMVPPAAAYLNTRAQAEWARQHSVRMPPPPQFPGVE